MVIEQHPNITKKVGVLAFCSDIKKIKITIYMDNKQQAKMVLELLDTLIEIADDKEENPCNNISPNEGSEE